MELEIVHIPEDSKYVARRGKQAIVLNVSAQDSDVERREWEQDFQVYADHHFGRHGWSPDYGLFWFPRRPGRYVVAYAERHSALWGIGHYDCVK